MVNGQITRTTGKRGSKIHNHYNFVSAFLKKYFKLARHMFKGQGGAPKFSRLPLAYLMTFYFLKTFPF